MNITSSHLLKGMVIGIILLVCAQAWRTGRDQDAAAALPPENVSTVTTTVAPPAPPSPRYQLVIPSEGSIEFTQQLQQAQDPWKIRTDPDHVWHNQRQRASEMLIRLNMPPLDQ